MLLSLIDIGGQQPSPPSDNTSTKRLSLGNFGRLVAADDSDFLLLLELNTESVVTFAEESGYLGDPTPRMPNGQTFRGFVADTTFSQDRGFYQAAYGSRLNVAGQ